MKWHFIETNTAKDCKHEHMICNDCQSMLTRKKAFNLREYKRLARRIKIALGAIQEGR